MKTNNLRKFLLDETLANIQRRGLAKGFNLLEVTTEEETIRIPLEKIIELAFVKTE